jgi:hypothetical protein
LKGHHPVGNIDTRFYHSLPAVEKQEIVSRDEKQDIVGHDCKIGTPVSNVEQIVMVIGSTILTSATLAGVIKAYLESRRRKIKISIEGSDRHIEYEGPNLKKDVAEIELMIERLAEEGGKNTLDIVSVHLPESELTDKKADA